MSGLFARVFEKRGVTIAQEFLRPGVGAQTNAGVPVSESSSLKFSAVFRAVDLLAKHIAMLPLHVYERTGDRTKRRAVEHPLYRLLLLAPNSEMTPYNYKHVAMAHVLLWGNHYAEIEWNAAGYPVGLWPLRPDRMELRRTPGGDLVYRYELPGSDGKVELPAYRVLHVRGFTLDGLTGKSVIGYARETIGLGLAAEEFGARFFDNDARPGGVLQHPNVLSEPAYERLQKSWESRHGGLSRSHRMAILEEGMSYTEIGIPPVDAQFLETRKFQVTDVARWFGVPPHKLMDLERSTFSNIEHQAIEYVQDSLQPWATNYEQAIDRQLLLDTERPRLYCKFALDALLRGDSTARHSSYGSGLQNGYYSVNDVRKLEDLDPVDGGDQHFRPLNMAPLDAPFLPAPASAAARQADLLAREHSAGARETRAAFEARSIAAARQSTIQAHGALFEDVFGSLTRREANDIGNQLDRLAEMTELERTAWLNGFYERFAEVLFDKLLPVYLAFASVIGGAAAAEIEADAEDLEAFVRAYLAAYVDRHIANSRAAIEPPLDDGDGDLARQVVDRWRSDRGGSLAAGELVRLANAAARAVYVGAGITALRWVTSGDSCPYCRNLDGRIVAIDRPFVDVDEDFKPDGADKPLRPNRKIGHPPLHGGCDCQIVAVRL